MKLKDLCSYLDSAVPLSFQESYDNSGFRSDCLKWRSTSALITLDVTEEVIDEAIASEMRYDYFASSFDIQWDKKHYRKIIY